MAEVALEGVSKFFPLRRRGELQNARRLRHAAVRDLHLTVRDGELLVLVGPSGCGKTTTLRLIAGLEDPCDGIIRIGERVVNDVPARQRNIAMVFQHLALYPHFTVYNNLAFGLTMRRGGGRLRPIGRQLSSLVWPGALAEERREIDRRVRHTARTLGIDSMLDRRPGELSGGQRQRVALGRAMVREPAVFLFDEPFSNLDAPWRIELRSELKRIHRQLQATMLFVTHDQTEALVLGDRVAVMDQGRVHQVDAPQEVYHRPRNRLVAGFFGSPPMNFLEGRVTATPAGIQFQGNGVSVPLEQASAAPASPSADASPLDADIAFPPTLATDRRNAPVVLGVRPEDVLPRHAAHEEAGLPAARARVAWVENLGDTALVYLEVMANDAGVPRSTGSKGAKLISKTTTRIPVRPGDAWEVAFRPRRIHLFDGATGESLATPGRAPFSTASTAAIA